MSHDLKPCPFCGGPVQLEEANRTRDRYMGERRWWGVTCRNTINLGGTCCMDQVPSASIDAAVKRWNMRDGVAEDDYKVTMIPRDQLADRLELERAKSIVQAAGFDLVPRQTLGREGSAE